MRFIRVYLCFYFSTFSGTKGGLGGGGVSENTIGGSNSEAGRRAEAPAAGSGRGRVGGAREKRG